MGSQLLLVLCLIIVDLISSENTSSSSGSCGAEIAAHHLCLMKAQTMGQPHHVSISVDDLKNGLEKCFTDNGCKKPTLQDHTVTSELVVALPHPTSNVVSNCFEKLSSMTKVSQEACVTQKLPGFTFANPFEVDKANINNNGTTAQYVASFWVYEVSSQMYDTSICTSNSQTEKVDNCCKDSFGKVFYSQCDNAYQCLHEGAKRFVDVCTACKNCSALLSPTCKLQYNASMLIIKGCAQQEHEKEDRRQNYTSQFLTCMDKSNETVTSYLKQPNMAKFQADTAISKWSETMRQNLEFNCDLKLYFDQYRPHAIYQVYNHSAPGDHQPLPQPVVAHPIAPTQVQNQNAGSQGGSPNMVQNPNPPNHPQSSAQQNAHVGSPPPTPRTPLAAGKSGLAH